MVEPAEGTQTAEILRLARSGVAQKLIALQTGSDYRYVGTVLWKLRERGLLEPPDKGWSDEELEALRDAVTEQRMSGGQAAAFLSAKFGRTFTRNMTIGKAKRLGLELLGGAEARRATFRARRESRHGSTPRPTRAVAAVQKSRDRIEAAAAPLLTPAPPIIAPALAVNGAPAPAAWVPRRVSLLDLRIGDCRYPLGDPRSASFAFCGAAAPIDKAYCPHCARVAYETPAQRAAVRKAWRAARGLPVDAQPARHGAPA